MTTENEAANTQAENEGGENFEPQTDGVKKIRDEREKFASENAQLKRELAFTKAGINPDDPKMRYFVKGYEGELDAEAVKSAAIEAGFLEDQEQAAKEQELAAHERVDSASAGMAAQPPAQGDFEAELANASNETEVMKVVAKYRPELIPQQ